MEQSQFNEIIVARLETIARILEGKPDTPNPSEMTLAEIDDERWLRNCGRS